MKNEISDYLRMIDDADNAHSPTSRAAYADALIDVLRDIFTDEEIQALAQAKAEGRLVVLPCKVGDTIYFPDHYKKRVDSRLITGIRQNTSGTWQAIGGLLCFPFSNFGVSIFLTREEAEKAIGGKEDE